MFNLVLKLILSQLSCQLNAIGRQYVLANHMVYLSLQYEVN